MRYAKQVCPVPRALNLGIPSNFRHSFFPRRFLKFLALWIMSLTFQEGSIQVLRHPGVSIVREKEQHSFMLFSSFSGGKERTWTWREC